MNEKEHEFAEKMNKRLDETTNIYVKYNDEEEAFSIYYIYRYKKRPINENRLKDSDEIAWELTRPEVLHAVDEYNFAAQMNKKLDENAKMYVRYSIDEDFFETYHTTRFKKRPIDESKLEGSDMISNFLTREDVEDDVYSYKLGFNNK